MTWVIIGCMWVFGLANPTPAQQAVRIYPEDGSQKGEALSAFIADVASTRLGQAIPVVVVYDPPYADPPALVIRAKEEQTWQVEPVPPQGLPRSPLLPQSSGFTIELARNREDSGWILNGLLSYSAGECTYLTALLMQRIESVPRETQSAMYYYLGHCLVAERSFGAAIEQYRRSVASTHSTTWQQQSALAWALLSAGQSQASAALIDEMVKRADLDTADMLALRAYHHLLIFDTDRATQDALKALAARPNHLDYLVLNGQIALARYEWDEALMWLDRAWRIDPSSPDVNYHLGILFYTRADRVAAARFFARVIQVEPDGDRAASALRYLAMIRRETETLNTEE